MDRDRQIANKKINPLHPFEPRFQGIINPLQNSPGRHHTLFYARTSKTGPPLMETLMHGIFALSIVFSLILPGMALAQMDHKAQTEGMMHGTMAADTPPVLREPGQGAFAALAKIVTLLNNDPDTDWSRVDLRALRDHLVDMDRVITDTEVQETILSNGIRAVAGGDPETQATLRRMVPAHARELSRDTRWSVTATERESGVVLTVTSDDPDIAARIKALGFFGLMASQDHHRRHHLMMARGERAHGH